ncbi:hypothetical protein [Nocardia brasiliensis]|uniref:hypothetical protein n=1 Tax=Nocardia brasiliensis TaxID=37326 RepID=UPI0024576995|nr:hypothetical protein [Nocardia brasiliensis]
MPLLNIRTSAGVFTDDEIDALVARLTEAAWRAESLPDTPAARLRAVAIHSEIASRRLYCGGQPADNLLAVVLVEFTAGDGVLDPVRRHGFAADLQRAATESAGHAGDRAIMTSVTFNEVPEGRWGRDGAIVRLPEMAAVAGFEHLTAIAEGNT